MDINTILNNPNVCYYGHGTGASLDDNIDSIFKNGLRCSHGSMYYTTVPLGIGTQISEKEKNILDNWEHLDSKYIVIVGIPIGYELVESYSRGLSDRYMAFNYIPTKEQRDKYNLTESPYILPEFIVGYYNANDKTFVSNPKYYEKLSIEEQKEIFDKIKENFFRAIDSSYGIDSYKSMIESFKWNNFPLRDDEIENFKKLYKSDENINLNI